MLEHTDETNTEFERFAEYPVHISKTVVSSLRRALNSALNRKNRAAAQAEQIEKLLSELNGKDKNSA